MNLENAYNELIRLSKEQEQAVNSLFLAVREYAHAENIYRKAKAVAYLASEGTVQNRQASVDMSCESERLAAHIAEGIKEATHEKVRGIRAQLSAYQTFINGMKAETELATYKPNQVNTEAW